MNKQDFCKKFFFCALLPVALFLLSACSKDGSDDTPTPVKFSFTLTHPDREYVFLCPSPYDTVVHNKFTSYYTSDSPKHVAFVKQDNKITYLGEFGIEKIGDGKDGRIEIDGTGKMTTDKPYELFMAGGTCYYSSTVVNKNVSLVRGKGFNGWIKYANNESVTTLAEHIAGTVELLVVLNKSAAPIKFQHKGFDVEKKWYYSFARLSLIDGTISEVENGEAKSEVHEIPLYPSRNKRYILSYYVPNGNKIQDAQLIAEIDGKEVRSVNRISSDIIPQIGKVYVMFAVWDGEKLTLIDSNYHE